MFIRKITKQYKKLIDNYHNHFLLEDIKPVVLHDSEFIFIFSPVRIKFYKKLYALISHKLSMLGMASCFPFTNDSFSSHYPEFVVDELDMNNALSLGKTKRIVKSLAGEGLFYKWAVDLKKEKIETQGINFFPIILCTLRSLQKRYNVFYHDEDNEIRRHSYSRGEAFPHRALWRSLRIDRD